MSRAARSASPAGRAAAGAAVAGLAVLAAGCGSSSTVTAPTTTPVTGAGTTTTVSTVPPPPTTGPVSSTPASTTPPVVARCATSQLAGSVTSPDGTAGGEDFTLALRNTGSSPCVLQGYAGVSVVAAHGRQVGAAARRIAGSEPAVTVAPGSSGEAVVSVADAGDFPASCGVTAVLGFRVYAPDNTTSLFVPRTLSTCASRADRTLAVGPFHPA